MSIKRSRCWRLLGTCLLLALSACSDVKPVAFYEQGTFPAALSEWNLFSIDEGEWVPNERVVPYDLKSALFSDYAHKFRTVYVPEGTAPANSLEGGGYDLPVGSILSKTFYYPVSEAGLLKSRSESEDFAERGLALDRVKLIETRLLVRTTSGWVGLPYVWNDTGTEALLEVTGAEMDLVFADGSETVNAFKYVVPDFNQCQGCHIENLTAGGMAPVGFKAHHIDKPYDHLHQTENQLEYLARLGYIESGLPTIQGIVDWQDETASLDDRARSYLDINCGHCHNPTGPADTSGMFLTRDTRAPIRLGLCKPPVAAGQGTGGRPVGIHPGEPAQSILPYRMNSLDLGAMMPELGRSLVHQEGVALIEQWIKEMPGAC